MKTPARLILLLLLLAGLAVTVTLLALRTDPAPVGIAGSAPVASPTASNGSLESALESRAEATQRAVAAESQAPEAAPEVAVDDAAATALPPGTPVLVGRIFDQNGIPVPGARVAVERWTESSRMNIQVGAGGMGARRVSSEKGVTTDDKGRFTHERHSKLGTDVAVQVHARGFLVLRERVELQEEAGDAYELGDFNLQPGVVIAGRVVDPHGGAVEDARIRRTDESDELAGAMLTAFEDFGLGATMGEVKSDEDGQFELPYEEGGPFRLAIRHERHPDSVFDGMAPTAGGTVDGLVIILPAGASIEGVVAGFPADRKGPRVGVTPVETNAPQESGEAKSGFAEMMSATFGAGVERQARIDPDGAFAVHGLVPGREYEVRVFEKRNFVETRDVSNVVRARAGATGVRLDFDHGSSIVVEVLGDDTGEPPERIRVQYDWDARSEVTVFGSGTKSEVFRKSLGPITLTELRPRNDPDFLDLTIAADDYWTHTVEGVTIPMHDEVDLGTVRLRRAPRLRVRVLDEITKQPVRRARVELAEHAGRPAPLAPDSPFAEERLQHVREKTDREGWADIPVFQADAVDLNVTAKGYAPHHHASFKAPDSGGGDWTVHLSRGGAIDIVVLDSEGQPADDAVVHGREEDESILSVGGLDAEGRVAVEGLEPGEYRFRALRGNRTAQMQVRVESSDHDDDEDERWTAAFVQDGERTTVVLEVPAYGNLRGVVSSGGLPLPNAHVSIVGDARNEMIEDMQSDLGEVFGGGQSGQRTDRAGRYEIDKIPAGQRTLRVRHDSRSMATRIPVEIEAGDNTLDVELPEATIEGRVVDAEGRPIAGARVEAYKHVGEGETAAQMKMLRDSDFFGPSPGAVYTNDAGRYSLHGIQVETPLVIEASGPKYIRGASEEVEVRANEVRSDVDIVLHPGGTIRAEVEGAAPFVFVTATRDGDEEHPEQKMAVARGGTALVTGLAPGIWRVKLSGGGDQESEDEGIPVEVRAGVEASVRLTL